MCCIHDQHISLFDCTCYCNWTFIQRRLKSKTNQRRSALYYRHKFKKSVHQKCRKSSLPLVVKIYRPSGGTLQNLINLNCSIARWLQWIAALVETFPILRFANQHVGDNSTDNESQDNKEKYENAAPAGRLRWLIFHVISVRCEKVG